MTATTRANPHCPFHGRNPVTTWNAATRCVCCPVPPLSPTVVGDAARIVQAVCDSCLGYAAAVALRDAGLLTGGAA